MSNSQLYVPTKIKVGFDKRDDTYTGKLAYVICYDKKGKLRKEKSWQDWRDHKIPPLDLDNSPTDGFVLNKGVGGARESYGWNARNEYIRVYDPRDFEFEISVANLLFILKEGVCSPGKGLEGKFVYSWDGKDLVLLPVCSGEYKNSLEFTNLQTQKVSSKDLIKGATYLTKAQKKLIYLGKLEKHQIAPTWGGRKTKEPVLMQHIFEDEKGRYQFFDGVGQIAKLESDAVVPDYAEKLQKYLKSYHGSKIVSLSLKPVRRDKPKDGCNDYWAYELEPGVFVQAESDYNDWDKPNRLTGIQTRYKVELKNGIPVWTDYVHYSMAPGVPKATYGSWRYDRNQRMEWMEPTKLRLFAKLESGEEYQLGEHAFLDAELAETALYDEEEEEVEA